MLTNKTSFHYQRLKALYEKEISFILNKLKREREFPACSVSYSESSAKFENLKVYLLFANKKSKKYLEILNKNYLTLVKKYLANSKKFAKIPKVTFSFDEQLEKIFLLEEIVQKIK